MVSLRLGLIRPGTGVPSGLSRPREFKHNPLCLGNDHGQDCSGLGQHVQGKPGHVQGKPGVIPTVERGAMAWFTSQFGSRGLNRRNELVNF